MIELFNQLNDEEKMALVEEGTRLLDFIDSRGSSREILFV